MSSGPRPPSPRPSSRPERQAAGDLAQRDNILGIDAKRELITIVVAVILVVGSFSLIGKAADFDEILEALEDAIDACETAADVVGNIVVKNL